MWCNCICLVKRGYECSESGVRWEWRPLTKLWPSSMPTGGANLYNFCMKRVQFFFRNDTTDDGLFVFQLLDRHETATMAFNVRFSSMDEDTDFWRTFFPLLSLAYEGNKQGTSHAPQY